MKYDFQMSSSASTGRQGTMVVVLVIVAMPICSIHTTLLYVRLIAGGLGATDLTSVYKCPCTERCQVTTRDIADYKERNGSFIAIFAIDAYAIVFTDRSYRIQIC